MAIVNNDKLKKFDERNLNKEWMKEHDFQLDYPYNGCLFDRCHQSFIDQKDVIFGMIIDGGIQDIKNIADPFYQKRLNFTKVWVGKNDA